MLCASAPLRENSSGSFHGLTGLDATGDGFLQKLAILPRMGARHNKLTRRRMRDTVHKLLMHKQFATPPPAAPRPKTPPAPQATFESLGLSDVMLDALDLAGYEYPTPIQAGLIPLALKEIDVVGQARTGTGKTASFAIPILEKLQLKSDIHHPQALVMVPTRELAVQVKDEIVKLSEGRRVHCCAVYGGKPIRQQIEKLRKGAQIVVGTPGRVL